MGILSGEEDRGKCTSAFSFDQVGAKEKAWQKEKRRRGVSRSAEREEGCAPSTAPPFEKRRAKTFLQLNVNP
jgi:hypothetical protein